MNQELISVIIPVYNVEKYLDRCLESVLNQTYKNLEIILVDDGSTDNSGNMCDEYVKKDQRVVVIHKKNGGASTARNVGLDCAQGQYIGFVDSDDWIKLDMYEYLYNLLHAYDADISMCLFTRKQKDMQSKICSEKVDILEHSDLDKFFYRLNGEASLYGVYNRLYKRKTISGIRFMENKITEDVLYTYQVYKEAKRLVVSNLVKYYYFMNESGVTRSQLCFKDLDLLEMWDWIVEDTRNTEYYEWAILNRKRAIFTLYSKGLIYGIGKEFDTTIIRSWKTILRNEYTKLMKGKMLDIKRKALLTYIVLNPT